MPQLVSEADVALENPAGVAAALAEHLLEHDVVCELKDGRYLADLGVGAGVLEPTATALKLRVEAADLGKLQILRSWVAEHVVEFAGMEPDIVWRGAEPRAAAFANFREMRLERTEDVAPRIRRLTFSGDAARFASDADIHVRMYFPPAGVATPEWPRPGPDGRTIWPADEARPSVRYYTVRRANLARGEIEIDFVMHDEPGPGSNFAARARPGAICGMAGPLGRGIPSAGWTLLAGDETALPAIARILETMPRDANGAALIEVLDDTDRMALSGPEGVRVQWLSRVGAPAGTTTLLIDAIRRTVWEQGHDMFAWVACEYGRSKDIRKHLKAERGVPREKLLVVGYWELGSAGD